MDLEFLSAYPNGPSTSDGPVKSPPLLFVHGAWQGAWCWNDHFLPYFASRGYDAYALSLRGHGGSPSDRPLRWLRIRDYVADVVKAVESLSRQPVLVGHSMGGFVVQKYLETRSAAGAIFVASVPPSGALATAPRIALRVPAALVTAFLTLRLKPIVATPERTRALLFTGDIETQSLRSVQRRLQDESVLAFLDMLFLDVPAGPPQPVPALVLGSDSDALISPRATKETARAFETEATMLSGLGHDMMLDPQWQEAADRILSWLNQQRW
jgi:pimeloyl-ACP methyl ester carboxylesterase